MHIHVKLYGDLKAYAPGDQTQFTLTLEPGATLGEILDLLNVPDDTHVSLINGRRAVKDAHFQEGDTLVLFPPITGG